MSQKVPLPKALAIIVMSTFLISGSAYSLMRLYVKMSQRLRSDPQYFIQNIVQKTPQVEGLKSVYLAELMGLSKDQPLSIFSFNIKQAEEALKQSPLIVNPIVRKEGFSTVSVDYTMRSPVATLFDYENTAVDEEGMLFPVYPFFSPKRLPEIYLGLKAFDPEVYSLENFYATPLTGEEFKLALKLIHLLEEAQLSHQFFLKRVDTSSCSSVSLGRREIDLILENRDHSHHYLRLSIKFYEQQLANYLKLREEMILDGKDRTIDLRLQSLAYIDEMNRE